MIEQKDFELVALELVKEALDVFTQVSTGAISGDEGKKLCDGILSYKQVLNIDENIDNYSKRLAHSSEEEVKLGLETIVEVLYRVLSRELKKEN